jgi:hypothetical protein
MRNANGPLAGTKIKERLAGSRGALTVPLSTARFVAEALRSPLLPEAVSFVMIAESESACEFFRGCICNAQSVNHLWQLIFADDFKTIETR